MSRDRAFSGLFAALAVLWSAGCAKAPDSGGGGGSGGGAAGTSGIVMKDPSNYPQNTAGAAFPYPQGHASTYCTFPIYSTDSVATAYTNWKAKFFDGTKIIFRQSDSGGQTTRIRVLTFDDCQ